MDGEGGSLCDFILSNLPIHQVGDEREQKPIVIVQFSTTIPAVLRERYVLAAAR